MSTAQTPATPPTAADDPRQVLGELLRKSIRRVDMALSLTQGELAHIVEALSDQIRHGLGPNYGLPVKWHTLAHWISQEEKFAAADSLLHWHCDWILEATGIDRITLADLIDRVGVEVRERGALFHTPTYWDHYHARREPGAP